MENNKKIFKELASGEMYAQSLMMAPITIISAARSAMNVKERTGLSYKGFLFEVRDGYGSMYYQVADLLNINSELWKKISEDGNYLKQLRKAHTEEQFESQKFYKEIWGQDLTLLSNSQILSCLRKSLEAIQNAVGLGHVIEGFAIMSDDRLKEELLDFTGNAKVNNSVYSDLAKPEEKSFFLQADELIVKIGESGMDKDLINKFKEGYYWIRSSYGSTEEVDESFILSEVNAKKDLPAWSKEGIEKEKKILVNKYSIPSHLEEKIGLVAYVGAWQDERKKYIMMALYHIFLFLDELSRRSGISTDYLKYIIPEELDDLKQIESKLKERKDLSYYAVDLEGFYVISGEEAKDFSNNIKTDHEVTSLKSLAGTVASYGKVIGTVKVCTDQKSLDKVNEGDVLVTSMTRPEYINAMKKAAAFVTDEGGITCHAAIISREMKKPCIIGTKNATKVFKDGDLVEVNANHGLVKLIN